MGSRGKLSGRGNPVRATTLTSESERQSGRLGVWLYSPHTRVARGEEREPASSEPVNRQAGAKTNSQSVSDLTSAPRYAIRRYYSTFGPTPRPRPATTPWHAALPPLGTPPTLVPSRSTTTGMIPASPWATISWRYLTRRMVTSLTRLEFF